MKHPLQKLIKDENGTIRFVPNKIVRFLLETSKNNLNDLSFMPFDGDDWIQFAQLIGYSLSGFSELPYVTDETYNIAENEAAKLNRGTNE